MTLKQKRYPADCLIFNKGMDGWESDCHQITNDTNTVVLMISSSLWIAASWSSGRVQDSGLGSRSCPEFNTLPVRLLVVPLNKALHTALLLSTQEEMGTCEGRLVSRGAKLRVSCCILPRELRWISKWFWSVKAQWPGKVLVKVCRAELWAWMWTQNSDLTFDFTLIADKDRHLEHFLWNWP